PPAVHRGAERVVGARHLLVLPLQRSDADMTLVLDRHLRRGRTHRHAARAAVEADATHPRLVDDRVVVDVRNVGDVDVGDGAVVVELVSAPVAALKAAAEIAEAVVDAAVETRSEEHTSELQSRENLVCRLLLEKKKKRTVKNKSIKTLLNVQELQSPTAYA